MAKGKKTDKDEKPGKGAKSAKGAKPAKKKGGGLGYQLLGFLMLILGLMMLPSSTLLVAGMIPTFIAFLTDSDRRKTSAISVGTVNICGVIPFEITLWQGANTMAQVGQMLHNVETWAVMYGAATIGAVIHYAVPPVVGGFIALQSSARVAELERRQTQLRETWGDEVSKPPIAVRVKAAKG